MLLAGWAVPQWRRSLPPRWRLGGGTSRHHITGMPLQSRIVHARPRHKAGLGLAAASGRGIQRGLVWAVHCSHHLGQVAQRGVLLRAPAFKRHRYVRRQLCVDTWPLCNILFFSSMNSCICMCCGHVSRVAELQVYIHICKLLHTLITAVILVPTCHADIP